MNNLMLKACVKFNFDYDVWNLPTKLKKKRRVPLVAFSIQRQKNYQLWPIIGHYSVSLSVYKDQKKPIKKGVSRCKSRPKNKRRYSRCATYNDKTQFLTSVHSSRQNVALIFSKMAAARLFSLRHAFKGIEVFLDSS